VFTFHDDWLHKTLIRVLQVRIRLTKIVPCPFNRFVISEYVFLVSYRSPITSSFGNDFFRFSPPRAMASDELVARAPGGFYCFIAFSSRTTENVPGQGNQRHAPPARAKTRKNVSPVRTVFEFTVRYARIYKRPN